MSERPWERHAQWWQDHFTGGIDPEYEEQILPLVDEHLAGATRVLDVGCGEGQVSRRAAAEHLPLPDGAVDAVVICLTLEHLDPFEPAVHEIARVLAVGGVFCCFLNHPLLQTPGSGWIDDQILGEQYWRVGPYLPDDVAMEEVAPGIRLPFMHRPLGRYINVMADRGLLVERMVEPPPPPGFVARAPEYAEAAAMPRLLLLRARKHA